MVAVVGEAEQVDTQLRLVLVVLVVRVAKVQLRYFFTDKVKAIFLTHVGERVKA
jgi:hypothetical protein